MKRYSYSLVGLLALLLAWVVPIGAVNVTPGGLLSNTTLNGAINSTQTTLVLTSASASSGSSFGAPAANQCLYLDLEMMIIRSVSSTTMTVTRGTRNRSAHATSAIILTGPCDQFKVVDPPTLVGNQDCTLFVLPWVNQITGDTWWCDLQAIGDGSDVTAGGSWSVTNPVARNGTAGSRRVAQ